MIQIFGTKKCKTTKKAERFFKERRVKYQFIDLTQKGLSKGELRKIASAVNIDNMIDENSKVFVEKGLKYMNQDKESLILEYPLILKTPIVRNSNKAVLGYEPNIWKSYLD